VDPSRGQSAFWDNLNPRAITGPSQFHKIVGFDGSYAIKPG